MTKGKDAKPHIGIYGRRNNGKSSIINVILEQDHAIVSNIPGTTTDPVKKSIELPGLGSAILIDTAGIDDSGDLGQKRIQKTLQTLPIVDAAILVITANTFGSYESKLVEEFKNFEIPYLILHNKSDEIPLNSIVHEDLESRFQVPVIAFSALKRSGTDLLLSALSQLIPESAWQSTSLIGDLVKHGDLVLLITPIDIEAPEGRLILPQVQTIRDALDNDCTVVISKEREVGELLKKLHPRPALVITDSQVFPKADAAVPKDIPLTSFSIILAKQKGDFRNYLKGTPHLGLLKDGDRILILESCTHHVSCDDIGRVKIPRWLTNYNGKKLEFEVVSGLNKLPGNITDYAMVIQCGGCMITRRQIINRLKPAVDEGIPVTNYGMAIAWIHGIYQRAISPFVAVENSAEYL